MTKAAISSRTVEWLILPNNLIVVLIGIKFFNLRG